MPILFAHFSGGHWVTYALYAVPVVIVLGSVVSSYLRERGTAKNGPEHS